MSATRIAAVQMVSGPDIAQNLRDADRLRGDLLWIVGHVAQGHEAGEDGEIARDQPRERRAGAQGEEVERQVQRQHHARRGAGPIQEDRRAAAEAVFAPVARPVALVRAPAQLGRLH